MKQTEHEEQKILIQWTKLQENKYPELRLLFAIPNGGARHIAVARKLKSEGVKAGVPDLFLPVGRSGYHGLFIEMKAGKNKPTEDQIGWLEALEDEGYLAQVCWGFEEAKAMILGYLKKPKIDDGLVKWDYKEDGE